MNLRSSEVQTPFSFKTLIRHGNVTGHIFFNVNVTVVFPFHFVFAVLVSPFIRIPLVSVGCN